MQFQVPQFIDVENKIVGPLTFKQFLYLAAAGGISFFLFFVFTFGFWFIVSAVVIAIAAALAFGKYNGQPLPQIALKAFGFFWKPKLYLWARQMEMKTIEIPEISEAPVIVKRKNLKQYFSEMPSVTKLMVNLMTTKAPIPKREKSVAPHWGKPPKEKFEVFRKLTGEKEIARRVDYR